MLFKLILLTCCIVHITTLKLPSSSTEHRVERSIMGLDNYFWAIAVLEKERELKRNKTN